MRAEADVLRAEAYHVVGAVGQKTGPCNACAEVAVDFCDSGVGPAVFEKGSDAAIVGAQAFCAAKLLAKNKVETFSSALRAAVDAGELASMSPISEFCITVGADGCEVIPFQAGLADIKVARRRRAHRLRIAAEIEESNVFVGMIEAEAGVNAGNRTGKNVDTRHGSGRRGKRELGGGQLRGAVEKNESELVDAEFGVGVNFAGSDTEFSVPEFLLIPELIDVEIRLEIELIEGLRVAHERLAGVAADMIPEADVGLAAVKACKPSHMKRGTSHGRKCADLTLMFATEEVAESFNIFGDAQGDATLFEALAHSCPAVRELLASE